MTGFSPVTYVLRKRARYFRDDEFEVTTATTVDEAKQALSAGFDYVTEKNGIMLFKRPRRFSKYAG